jgi:uncharacterized protein YkwD
VKKATCILFAAIFLLLSLIICTAAFAQETLLAIPTNAVIYINNTLREFDAYNINGNNYFKLRDLAYTLNGSEKQFAVEWTSAPSIMLTGHMPYAAVGGEMTAQSSLEAKQALPATAAVFLNGQPLEISAYYIEGNNYFKLRDIAQLFDFCVFWDAATRTIDIDTKQPYIANGNDKPGYAAEIIRMVNDERGQHNMPLLTTTDRLSAAAQKRAEELLEIFGHERPDGRDCFTVFDDFSIGHVNRGENIAIGHSGPDILMQEWMDSSGHRNNILGDFLHIGVGVVKNEGDNTGYAWVLLLVK